MTDNVLLNAGTGGASLATDDIGGVHHQRVKVVIGKDGVSDGDVSSMNPMPVGLMLADSCSGDAFSRVRTAEPKALLEIMHQYDLAPRLMGLQRQDVSTTITHTSPTAVLAVPAVGGRRICHQSHRYCIYQPGKSHLIRITGQLGDGTLLAGMGYGDDADGIFLERTSTGLQIRFSSSTIADQLVAQASWNIDKLDGTGVSGMTLDPSKTQHLVIDLQWLAVGRVRVGIALNGHTHFVHYFQFSNTIVTAYTRAASLPVRWYAESLGTAGSMMAICASVVSEGGHDPHGQFFSYGLTTAKALLGAGVRTPLISLRPKLLFGALDNHAHLIPADMIAMVSTADNVLLEIIADGTLTGGTFAVALDATSHAEVDSAATAIAGGRTLWGDYISSQSRIPFGGDDPFHAKNLPLVIRANGTDRDVLTLCATRIAGAASVFGGMNWTEVR